MTYDMTYLVGSYGICDDICGGSYGITAHVMICITHDISFLICAAAMEFFFVFFDRFPYWLFLIEIFFTIFSSFSLMAFPYWLFVFFGFSLLAF